ncbi:MAG TPA: ankyrin repeat domain-containing protein, partial [Candidatus Saccharimonadales bacterium]|nr:ankyrin repeat domain-containing protein [Candidatus Saccharimonadales bacterium]
MKKNNVKYLFFCSIVYSHILCSSLQTETTTYPDFETTSQFFNAVEQGNIQDAKNLLLKGTIPKDICNGVGDTALIVAIKNQKREMIQFLIEQGFDKNERNCLEESAIEIAVQQNYNDAIKDLCCLGNQPLDVSVTDRLQNTPLHIMADKDNYIGICILLMHAKADPEKRNYLGCTPLHTACARGALNAVKCLLSLTRNNGIRYYTSDPYRSPSYWATPDNAGRSPLYWAIANENYDVAEKLVQEGVKIDSPNHKYETVLELFIKQGNARAVKKLLNFGASAHTPYGDLLIYTAAKYGHADIIKIMLDAGIDKNAQTRYAGNTVLHNAVNTGSVKMVRMLLDFGVDKTIKNFSGKTPLETAQNNMQTYAG